MKKHFKKYNTYDYNKENYINCVDKKERPKKFLIDDNSLFIIQILIQTN